MTYKPLVPVVVRQQTVLLRFVGVVVAVVAVVVVVVVMMKYLYFGAHPAAY